MSDSASAVIVGAGIAGVAAAHELAVRRGVRDVVLVDDLAPLTLTSDKSTECYRNWWPDAPTVALVNASIDRLEELMVESGDRFHMNRRGYVWATTDRARAEDLRSQAAAICAIGAGPLRVHDGSRAAEYPALEPDGVDTDLDGADLLLDGALIRERFPFLADDVVAVLHARRCGWFSAQQLGMYLVEQARERGLRLRRARVEGIDVRDGRVTGVRTTSGVIATEVVVDAAGPFAHDVAALAGVTLPLHNELHAKVAFRDERRAVPRGAPFMIYADPQHLWLAEDERASLPADHEWVTRRYPAGDHLRPEGGPRSDSLLLIWGYDDAPTQRVFPPTFDPSYAEVCLRGLVRMVPALATYVGHTPRPVIDGGYYAKTRENRPLVGPLPVRGLYADCAFSGFGVMAACGAATLLADHITGAALPDHAPAFLLSRYEDRAYLARIAEWGPRSGQL